MDAGADLVIHSVHKTLASFTQSSVLHRMSDRVTDADLMEKLAAIQSTSPSYLLMTSLEIAAAILEEHGEQLMEEWLQSLDEFYREAASVTGLQVLSNPAFHDRTKIDLSMQALGLSGKQLLDLLREDHQIELELSSGSLAMAMTGIGNSREDFQRLLRALRIISDGHLNQTLPQQQNQPQQPMLAGSTASGKAPHTPDLTPQELEDIQSKKEDLPLAESAGRISASLIIPYPPGIPLVCIGERITQSDVDQLILLRKQGRKVLGVNAAGAVQVLKP